MKWNSRGDDDDDEEALPERRKKTQGIRELVTEDQQGLVLPPSLWNDV